MQIWLIVATVLLSIATVAGILPALMSPMMFDAPGSMENRAIVTSAICVATFPIVCAVAIGLLWLLYTHQQYSAARIASLLPLINLTVGSIALFLWSKS